MDRSDPRIDPCLDFPPFDEKRVDDAIVAVRFQLLNLKAQGQQPQLRADELVLSLVRDGFNQADAMHAICRLIQQRLLLATPTRNAAFSVGGAHMGGWETFGGDYADIPHGCPTPWILFDVVATEPFLQPAQQVAVKKSTKRGRRSDTDMDEDRKICEAWKTGRHPTYVALAKERGKGEAANKIKLAIDRHRKRLSRRKAK